MVTNTYPGKYSGESLEETLDSVKEKYVKPADGIPKSDLEQSVQTTLNNADNHIGNKNNPHGVTPEQLGLDDVVHYSTISDVPYDGAVDGLVVTKIQQDLAKEVSRAKDAEIVNANAISGLASMVSYYETIKTV